MFYKISIHRINSYGDMDKDQFSWIKLIPIAGFYCKSKGFVVLKKMCVFGSSFKLKFVLNNMLPALIAKLYNKKKQGQKLSIRT